MVIKIDFCDVMLNALYEYLVSFLGSIDARTWRGYRLYGPRMGTIDNFSLVTGRRGRSQIFSNTVNDAEIFFETISELFQRFLF